MAFSSQEPCRFPALLRKPREAILMDKKGREELKPNLSPSLFFVVFFTVLSNILRARFPLYKSDVMQSFLAEFLPSFVLSIT